MSTAVVSHYEGDKYVHNVESWKLHKNDGISLFDENGDTIMYVKADGWQSVLFRDGE